MSSGTAVLVSIFVLIFTFGGAKFTIQTFFSVPLV